MKKIFLIAFISIATLIACKKNSTTDNTSTTDIAEAQAHTDDAAFYDGESDAVDDDINTTVALSEKFCGINIFASGTVTLPPDLDTTNSANTAKKIILTFNGNVATGSCRKRKGTITIELIQGNKWVETGAILKYTFNNFTVTNVCRNRSIAITGDRFVTNGNGGNLVLLRAGAVNSLVHQIRTGSAGLAVTFTDSLGVVKTANWNAARKTTITYNTPNYYFVVTGDTSLNAIANTANWGTNRYTHSFQTSIATAIRANTGCKLWRPTAGLVNYTINNFSASVLYGLDIVGNAASATCATHYKVSWQTQNGTTGSTIIPYR